MVGSTGAAGPSRRSHTKSRKGCKTCKRRHIRCDETFPQCRNCTKHQVQCDYMESVASDLDSGPASPRQIPLVFSPEVEARIEQWEQTGIFPFPALNVYPAPPIHEYSRAETRLVYHLASISHDFLLENSTNLTIWTEQIPKFLSLAAMYPFVMHAIISFAAAHLAFDHPNPTELRNLQTHHGAIALRGTHDAINNFSHANADALLAASRLLAWQCTDWRSWRSLRNGIQTIIAAMQNWKQESVFSDWINEESAFEAFHPRRPSVDARDRINILQNTMQAIESIRSTTSAHTAESRWVDQLQEYLLRLQASDPARTPEEQFGHLYHLRKWLFWMPVSLLQQKGGQGPAMLVLAHFYAAALALEPLFPDLGPMFCARYALAPLEVIIGVTDSMHYKPGYDQSTSMEIASLMQFPRQAALAFRTRVLQATVTILPSQPASAVAALDTESLSFSSIGNLSPAFAPAPLSYGSSQSSSTFLGVPALHVGATFQTPEWSATSAPQYQLDSHPYNEQPDHNPELFDYGMPTFPRGFVPTIPIWI